MAKILIVTSSFDKTVDYLINKYNQESFIRLNVDELDNYKISVSSHENFQVNIKCDTFEIENLFESISSIYYRKLFLPELKDYDAKYHTYMQKEIYSFVTGLVDSFDGRVVTTPAILRKVENKIFQLKVASALNFLLPKSLISNDHDTVNKFRVYETIGKPLSTGKLTKSTGVHSSIIRGDVASISLSPTYFQEYIPKDYELRITVVKDVFYCVKILADNKIDWRVDEEKNSYELIETPKIIREQCQQFMQVCNLEFGIFDYIVSGGKYYFLECNPNGQWLWLEMQLDLDISNSLVRLLNDK